MEMCKTPASYHPLVERIVAEVPNQNSVGLSLVIHRVSQSSCSHSSD